MSERTTISQLRSTSYFRITLHARGYDSIFYPSAYGAGSTLIGSHIIDVVGTGFVTTGQQRSLGPANVNFGTYYTVDDGRWPATWTVSSISGCGAGTSDEVLVNSKIVQAKCTTERGWMTVDPSSVYTDSTPASLQLSFDPAEIPNGATAEVYFVDPDGVVFVQANIAVDSNSQAVVPTPSLSGGNYSINYTVVATFTNLSENYGAETGYSVYCGTTCPEM